MFRYFVLAVIFIVETSFFKINLQCKSHVEETPTLNLLGDERKLKVMCILLFVFQIISSIANQKSHYI